MLNELHGSHNKILEEISWDDDSDFDETSPKDVAVDKSKLNAHEKAVNALDSMKFIENLDKKFDQVYKDVLNKDNDLELFSSKVQRFELKNISQIIKDKEKEKENQSEEGDEEKFKDDIQKLFNAESNDILKLFQSQTIQNNRKELYEMYDEIADINFIAYRMLRVYIDNILVKHMNTKQFFNIEKNELNQQLIKYEESVLHQVKKFIEMLLLYFDIPKKFKNDILPKTLKYGDYYIEIANLEPIKSIVQGKTELITENVELLEKEGSHSKIKKRKLNLALLELPTRKEKNIEEFESLNTQNLTPEQKLKKLKQKIFSKRQNLEEGEQSWIEEDNITLDDVLNLDYDVIDNIYLRFLDPSQVLKIVKDGVLYGYLVVEDIEEDNDNYDEVNIYKRFLADNENDQNNKQNTENVADILTKSILNKLGEFFDDDFNLDSMPDELQLSLKIMIYHKLLQKSKLKFRFIDPDRIANFHTVIDKFSPYGTSIFDPIVQPVKMYTFISVLLLFSSTNGINSSNIPIYLTSTKSYVKIVDTTRFLNKISLRVN